MKKFTRKCQFPKLQVLNKHSATLEALPLMQANEEFEFPPDHDHPQDEK